MSYKARRWLRFDSFDQQPKEQITHASSSDVGETKKYRVYRIGHQRHPIMSARTDTEAATTQATTGVTPESLRQTLITQLDATHVDIEDMSGKLLKPNLEHVQLAHGLFQEAVVKCSKP